MSQYFLIGGMIDSLGYNMWGRMVPGTQRKFWSSACMPLEDQLTSVELGLVIY